MDIIQCPDMCVDMAGYLDGHMSVVPMKTILQPTPESLYLIYAYHSKSSKLSCHFESTQSSAFSVSCNSQVYCLWIKILAGFT